MGRGGAGDDEEEDMVAQEEHKVWKKNAPLLYDLAMTHTLEYPSLTVQWLPDVVDGADYTAQRLLLGTQAEAGEQNYLLLAEAKLPHDNTELDAREFAPGTFGAGACNVAPVQLINHEGEVNRARYMPQNPRLVATKTVSGELHVFETSRHPARPPAGGGNAPDMRLTGHTDQGFGVCWSPLLPGRLLSGSNDALICCWDITAAAPTTAALHTYTGHTGAVGDVAWHASQPFTFGSVGDDCTLRLWDTRKAPGEACVHTVQAHAAEVYCLAFNPRNEHLLATGGADKSVELFDTRRLGASVHTLVCDTDDLRTGEVLTLAWSPHHASVLASCGAERRVMTWDFTRVGAEQSPEDAEDGPPELLFSHGGHTARVSDFAWNAQQEWTVASVAEDHQLQIWHPVPSMFQDEDADA